MKILDACGQRRPSPGQHWNGGLCVRGVNRVRGSLLCGHVPKFLPNNARMPDALPAPHPARSEPACETGVKKSKTLKTSIVFSSNICRAGVWHGHEEHGAYCSHYIKIQIGFAISPA